MDSSGQPVVYQQPYQRNRGRGAPREWGHGLGRVSFNRWPSLEDRRSEHYNTFSRHPEQRLHSPPRHFNRRSPGRGWLRRSLTPPPRQSSLIIPEYSRYVRYETRRSLTPESRRYEPTRRGRSHSMEQTDAWPEPSKWEREEDLPPPQFEDNIDLNEIPLPEGLQHKFRSFSLKCKTTTGFKPRPLQQSIEQPSQAFRPLLIYV